MIKRREVEYTQKFGLLWDSSGILDADVWVSVQWLRAFQGSQLCWAEEETAPAWTWTRTRAAC